MVCAMVSSWCGAFRHSYSSTPACWCHGRHPCLRQDVARSLAVGQRLAEATSVVSQRLRAVRLLLEAEQLDVELVAGRALVEPVEREGRPVVRRPERVPHEV